MRTADLQNDDNPETAIIQLLSTLSEYRAKVDRLEIEMAAMRKAFAASNVPKKAWLRVDEVAEILNVSETTVRRYVSRGLLRRNAASRHLLVLAEDVDNFGSKVLL